MNELRITVRPLVGAGDALELEVRVGETNARVLYVVGPWPSVVAALSTYVDGLK